MLKEMTLIGFLLFAVPSDANAQDSDRVDQLEKEIQAMKLRLSNLESLLAPNNAQSAPVSGEGWKSIVNWRKLSKDMSANDVRELLGEPERIDGGNTSFWHYPKLGQVTFFREKVERWSEPRD